MARYPVRSIAAAVSAPAVAAAVVATAAGCTPKAPVNYQARPTDGAVEDGDRIAVERRGVRVVAGPPSVFPYALAAAGDDEPSDEASGGSDAEGQYQLFTRVRVDNLGSRSIDVLWDRARLAVPDGRELRLVDAARAAAVGRRVEPLLGREQGAGDAGRPAAARGPSAQPAPSPGREAVPAGEVALRALIPETIHRIDIGEPLVPLCDGCIFRLRIPIVIDGEEELFELPFRLEVEDGGDAGFRFLFWEVPGF